MILRIEKVTSDLIDDIAKLFGTEKITNDCWCMWFIIPVKDFHSAGSKGNRASFCNLVAKSEHPLGLLAYQGEEPVGWCATGPRSRYVRALKTPTYRGGDVESDSDIWLVPCLFVRKDVRGHGVSQALLEAAVDLAKENGATAIEGFPFSESKRRSSGDIQVGFEPLFSSCGFEVKRTPSPGRVVMRRELKNETQSRK
ncbi:MAG: GNAT family N-acetyltransferase [Chloroflexi bacterium]|nr:GNAT family N-acetyltransferase [Chloroflexota bacterium]